MLSGVPIFYTNMMAYDSATDELITSAILVLTETELMLFKNESNTESCYEFIAKYALIRSGNPLAECDLLNIDEYLSETEVDALVLHSDETRYAFHLTMSRKLFDKVTHDKLTKEQPLDQELSRYAFYFYEFESYSFFQQLFYEMNQTVEAKIKQLGRYAVDELRDDLNELMKLDKFKQMIYKRQLQNESDTLVKEEQGSNYESSINSYKQREYIEFVETEDRKKLGIQEYLKRNAFLDERVQLQMLADDLTAKPVAPDQIIQMPEAVVVDVGKTTDNGSNDSNMINASLPFLRRSRQAANCLNWIGNFYTSEPKRCLGLIGLVVSIFLALLIALFIFSI